ncbi:hypothetical protein NDU88_003344 [Pleurodeles waltl]|uniref:Uncharacterized protein n=1 Tax=Pleurodeles waltl TaxID=8319 RepID=A0AAV7SEG0_PLEWA|nr:hypothetical protein NDU88_003344 [Pleurodeles waltl]
MWPSSAGASGHRAAQDLAAPQLSLPTRSPLQCHSVHANQARCLQGPPLRSGARWVCQAPGVDRARHRFPQSTTARFNSHAPRSLLLTGALQSVRTWSR